MIEDITAVEVITGIAVVGIPAGFAYIAWRIRNARKKHKENPYR